MIVPQLSRCRQCKAYLHGTRLEGFLVENLIPAQVQRAPATATLVLFICLFYALMLALAGESALGGFSAYSLVTLGATHGPSIVLGEYWRFVTSIFGHHDPLHLILNLASLVFVGELVERTLDRKKMLLIYLAAGIASMMISHVWYTYGREQILYVSAGASGAVCGMIGAAWLSARKLGPQGAEIVSGMKRWTVLMLVWGFAVPGINNAAHVGGFLVGALLAYLTPVGITKSVTTQRVLSVVTIGVIAGVLACCALMFKELRGYPIIAGDETDQRIAVETCLATEDQKPSEDVIRKCELARRVRDDIPHGYVMLARHRAARGELAQAARLRQVATMLR
jgi:rhomboid protease GluP